MKLSDPKSVLCCSLVSKSFASILFQSQSLSLRLLSFGPSSLLIPSQLPPTQYPSDCFFFNHALLLGLTKLVSLFISVRSLHIELLCECPQLPLTPNHRSSWDFKFGHDNLKTFAILSKSSIEKIGKEGSESEQPRNNSYLDGLDEKYARQETTCSMHYANSIYPLLLLLVSQQPDIKSVEIVDSKNHGKLSPQGEQLAKLKKHMPNSMPRGNSKLVPWYYFTVWYVPELVLPRSGFVMKRVTLGVGSENPFPSSSIVDRIRGSANGFGDDIIFGEALTQILTNYYNVDQMQIN
ncbi:uncharacterized protein LOC131312543 [Rhododendron vialii]|uniref:uncharacterized protein LOC131312543 n=1 Tax=Rhododendron vialii TaxID=182163 RepID=UPI00265FADB6|nr:uncharacterized protein LOC131312543 [Rhododendron vialii]XP_058196374.1 uncharacterized protein LOC131312543 [Rhododendron vialii]